MSQRAGVIFAGRVVGIRHYEPRQGATGLVEIDFGIDDAIRGVSGASYTLREWAGVWAAGDEPLRLGQRYLMLLHAPGPSGLSSPVGGADGAIPIRGGVAHAIGPRASSATESQNGAGLTNGSLTVDLRWVAARTLRTVSYATGPPEDEPVRPSAMKAAFQVASKVQVDLSGTADVTGVPVESAAYADVAGLLRGSELSANARR